MTAFAKFNCSAQLAVGSMVCTYLKNRYIKALFLKFFHLKSKCTVHNLTEAYNYLTTAFHKMRYYFSQNLTALKLY